MVSKSTVLLYRSMNADGFGKSDSSNKKNNKRKENYKRQSWEKMAEFSLVYVLCV